MRTLLQRMLFSLSLLGLFSIPISYAQDPLNLPVGQMLVLDWNNERSFNTAPIFHLNDAILVVDAAFFSPAQRTQMTPVLSGYYSFSDEDALGQFDTNHDGILDNLDPIYTHLFLIYYAKGVTQKIISLQNTGIRMIILANNDDPDRPTSAEDREHPGQAKALLSTGTVIYFHKVINTNEPT